MKSLAVVIFLVVLISGCAAPAPTFSIASPANGATIIGSTVKVVLTENCTTFDEPSTVLVDNAGFFRVRLDGTVEQNGSKSTFIFENVRPGVHSILVESRRGDITAGLTPSVIETVAFSVVEGIPPVNESQPVICRE